MYVGEELVSVMCGGVEGVVSVVCGGVEGGLEWCVCGGGGG